MPRKKTVEQLEKEKYKDHSLGIVIGRRIESIRQSKGLSKKWVSVESETEWTHYLTIENGTTNVSVDKLNDILEAMDFPITEFFYPGFLDDVKVEREKWEKKLEELKKEEGRKKLTDTKTE